MECKSVSGKSTLTYSFAKVAKGDTHIQIEGNTGAGLFSNEVIPLKLLEKALAKKTFTSADIKPLLKGKSQNTAAFLIAILLNEKVVEAKERGYVWRSANAAI